MPKSKQSSLDLTDLLKSDHEVVSIEDMLTKKREKAIEVVLFWTTYTCEGCGRLYEYPTYGGVFTRYDILKRNNEVHHTEYRPFLPFSHGDLPRRTERHDHTTTSCAHCFHDPIPQAEAS